MQHRFKAFYVVLFIFLIKLSSVLYLVHLSKCNGANGFMGIASMAGDAHSYITPIDNLLNVGNYYYDDARAGRMPYLGSIYLVFRLVFSKDLALSALVVLQILLASVSTLYLAKISAKLAENKNAFWVFIALSLCAMHTTIFDFAVLTESFGTSFIGIFVYFYHNYLTYGRKSHDLLKSGFFLGLSILFKPYLSLLFLVLGLEFIWYYRQEPVLINLKKAVVCSLLVFLPFFAMNAPWTLRNYLVFQTFIPFQQDIHAGYGYSKAKLAVHGFIQTIGESFVNWDKRSAGCFFEPVAGLQCEYEIPERVLGKNLTIEKILKAKSAYGMYLKSPSDSLQDLVVWQFSALQQAYESDHPVASRLLTPLMLTKHFLIHSGSYFMPIKNDSPCFSIYQLAFKAFQSLLYYSALFIGMIGLFLLTRRDGKHFILPTIPVYLIVLFPISLFLTEARYFHLAFPMLLVGLTNIIFVILRWKKHGL